jgi:serine/threonine protein kinase
MDAGEHENTNYLVMELVEGLDLSRLIQRLGRLAPADACEVIRQASAGLQYAHERRLVHRDIKPSNLMLTPEGTVKILDMGIARLTDPQGQPDAEPTSTGQLMGTIDYMAPEQSRDTHQVDIRADIYSLGATMYKLLTGEAPFAGAEYDSLVKKVVALATQEPRPVTQRRPDIPAEVSSIVHRCLAKDPSSRFSTPDELARALAGPAGQAKLSQLYASAASVHEGSPSDGARPPP